MHLAGIDTNLLTTLDALLQEQSVSRAARRIGLSPSATSHALARLRAVLDDPLLVRAGRRMVLTPRAERLAPRVRRVVQEMARVFEPEPVFRPTHLDRTFRVAVAPAVEAWVVARLGRSITREAPRVRMLGSVMPDEPARALREGRLDLAIGVFDEMGDDIEHRALFTDEVQCIVRADHPRAGAWSIEQLLAAEHVVCAPPSMADRAFRAMLAGRGHSRRSVRTVAAPSSVPFAVAGSDAVGAVSEHLLRTVASGLDLRVLETPIERPQPVVSLVWHRRNDAEPAHAWLRDLTVELLAESAPARSVSAA